MTDPVQGVFPTENTFFGATIPGAIATTPHTWTADQNGLFHTATDLKAEWQGYYDTMVGGNAATLTFVQRLEGNAQAVFLNTKLNTLDAATQQRDREDIQREFDAVSGAMTELGMNAKAPLSASDYLSIERTLQSDPVLQELAMQGHGLNSPSEARYNGYTNDFQNNVDTTTLYVGGGLDNNQNALTDFMDDVVLSHLPFPTVAQNGVLEQLNQNGDSEDTLTNAAGAIDQAGAFRVYTAADFSQHAGTAGATPFTPVPLPSGPLPAGQMYSLTGQIVPTTISVDGHTWTADSNGLYQTTTNLAAEWQADYQIMLAGNGAMLTATQRIEGNAEVIFENTGLANLSAAQQAVDRADAQREFDAIETEVLALGLDPSARFTVASYLALEHGLQDNATLEELAVQGHGLNTPPAARYRGYTNDFQNNVDQKTLYAGTGSDTGQRAIADLFDDDVMTHVPFPTVAQNGELEQLNQNGDAEDAVQNSVDGMNQLRFGQTLKAADFNLPGNGVTGTEPTAGTETTFFAAAIPSTMTAGAHVWTIGADGKFHTATDLAAEWKGYYQIMLAGNGASLTATQREEGNAEAVFENTSLATRVGVQQSFREDAQREFDAIAVAMQQLGLGTTLLNAQDYLNIGSVIQSSAGLDELAIQGHGLNSPSQVKYNGYTNDFQNNSDNATYFVGSGGDTGEKAITDFFDDIIMTHLPFPVVSENGVLEQLNQNGANEDTLATVVVDTNESMFTRVFVASDFSKVATAIGAQVYVSPAMATAVPAAGPVPGAGQMLSLTGALVPTTLVVNGDTWVADAAGRYETTTDLTLQWYNAYQTALAGGPLTLTQRWEAQAEAVFENTALNQVGEGQGAIDRMDVQREIDAVVSTMTSLGPGTAPLTVQNYIAVEHALQGNAALEELAVQGHGLNNPWVAGATKYNGYTNDFQVNIDPATLYVGPGADNGERAIQDFFDDDIMTHLPFASIAQNGELEQLNQNGNAESTVSSAVGAMNTMLFGGVLKAANFMTPGAQAAPVAPAGPATITTLYGDTIAGTMTVNGHVWTADATGKFQTTINLEMEWRSDYQIMLAGHADTLTATQRMEGNAEAVFENTQINGMWQGAKAESAYREDVQRQIDAIAGAMSIDQASFGINPNAPLTEASYLQLGTTLHGNIALEELALQGHGVQAPPSARYSGAYGDFMAGADWSTYFTGGGADNGTLIVARSFNDVMSNLAFGSAYLNGAWQQLDMNGNIAESVQQAATALNRTMYQQVFVASDFSTGPTQAGAVVLVPGANLAAATAISSIVAAPNMVVTLSGVQIANTMTVNGHVWTADAYGAFHTVNLGAEWQAEYATMLAGNAASLTAAQRLEGNAEAVFENAGLTAISASRLQRDREDVQRQIDAMAGAMQINAAMLGTPASAVLLQGSYLAAERTLQGNAALKELSLQGEGVSTGSALRCRGYTGDVAAAGTATYIGGGIDSGASATGTFMLDSIMGNTAFAVIWHNGKLMQLNQSGQVELSVGDSVAALDGAMWNRTYAATDFKH